MSESILRFGQSIAKKVTSVDISINAIISANTIGIVIKLYFLYIIRNIFVKNRQPKKVVSNKKVISDPERDFYKIT